MEGHWREFQERGDKCIHIADSLHFGRLESPSYLIISRKYFRSGDLSLSIMSCWRLMNE